MSNGEEAHSTGRIRRRVVVHGIVQGVFFRDSIRQQALHFGVDGWVTNRAQGSVEAVFQGRPDAVAAVIEFCRTGPPRARVERVEVVEEPPDGLSGFDVR